MTICRDSISYYIQNLPFFTHFSKYELQATSDISEIRDVKQNEKIDIKKFPSTGIVAEGLFETEQGTRDQALFLYPGSFFGNLPYMLPRKSGTIKAVKDSKIIVIDPNRINKILFSSYKGLRGYFRNIVGKNIQASEIVNEYIKIKSKVITVFSLDHKSGATTFAGLLGSMLSQKGRTVILDISYSNNSIFNLYEVDLLPALIQKQDNGNGDGLINDRIVDVDDHLSLLNVTSGSRVMINTEILSPIISILSKKYKYIILDHSGYEKAYTGCIFNLSDIIFSIIRKPGERNKLYDLLDSELKEGQRIFYILNRHFSDKVNSFEGGYFFDDLKLKKGEMKISVLKNKVESEPFKSAFTEFTALSEKKKNALVAETNLLNASLLSGFFSTLYDKDISFDYFFSSSWSYLITALFVVSSDKKEFEKNFLKVFSEDKIRTYLDVTFPDEFLFKNRIFKTIQDMARGKRLEYYNIIPGAKLSDYETDVPRIFTTGYMTDIFSASFFLNFFEPQKIADNKYYSGFPLSRVRPADMLRTDVDEIRYVSVENKYYPALKKISVFSKRFMDQSQLVYDGTLINSVNKDIIIKADIEKYNARDILEITKEISESLI